MKEASFLDILENSIQSDSLIGFENLYIVGFGIRYSKK